MNLRFIKENGKMILQQLIDCDDSMRYKWEDVPTFEMANEPEPQKKFVKFENPISPTDQIEFQTQVETPQNPSDWTDGGTWATRPHKVSPPLGIKHTKEFWLIAGRYFENEHDALMWKDRTIACDAKVIHVREI